MSHLDTSTGSTTVNILQDVLRIVAETPRPDDAAKSLLQLCCQQTGAVGAALFTFEDVVPPITYNLDDSGLPTPEALEADVDAATSPTQWFDHQNGHQAPIIVYRITAHTLAPDKAIGAVWLSFTDHPEATPDLSLYLPGLQIVARQLRTQVRHKRLTRNQSEFTRIVSHDLRSPLTAMQGFASMLESGMVGDLNEKQLHFVEKILSGIQQMAKLVENIQDAGRYDPETGFYEMERTQCDLIEIVQRIVETHLLPAEKQELTIKTDIARNLPIINADAHMLERAITNLVDNAIKYTPNGGVITVGVSRDDDQLLVSVQDNGYGISPENQKSLFDRHVRIARQEHRKVKGTGLGLFIVRSVAQRHGGNAWVESVEGEGSTFFIRIPLDGENALIMD